MSARVSLLLIGIVLVPVAHPVARCGVAEVQLKRLLELEAEKRDLERRIQEAEARLRQPAPQRTEEWLLENARSFVIPEPHGVASAEAKALRVLLLRPDASEVLRRLASSASPAGRLYALCGLWLRAPEEYETLRLELAESRTVVRFSPTESELLQRRTSTIVSMLDEAMLKRILVDPEFDSEAPASEEDVKRHQRRVAEASRELYRHFYLIVHREGSERERAFGTLMSLGPFLPRDIILGSLALLRQDEPQVRDLAELLLRDLEPWARPFMDEIMDEFLALCSDELEHGGHEAATILTDGWGWHYASIEVFDRVLEPGGLEKSEMFLETVESIREIATATLLAREGVLFVKEKALHTVFLELDNGEGVRVVQALLESDAGLERLKSLLAHDDEDLHERIVLALRGAGADGRAFLREHGGDE